LSIKPTDKCSPAVRGKIWVLPSGVLPALPVSGSPLNLTMHLYLAPEVMAIQSATSLQPDRRGNAMVNRCDSDL